MTDKQSKWALLSRFDKHYKFKMGHAPTYNKWKEQKSAEVLVESYTLETCYALLEYYFEVTENPTWNHFSYISDDILKAKTAQEKDLKERAERRKIAKEKGWNE